MTINKSKCWYSSIQKSINVLKASKRSHEIDLFTVHNFNNSRNLNIIIPFTKYLQILYLILNTLMLICECGKPTYIDSHLTHTFCMSTFFGRDKHTTKN